LLIRLYTGIIVSLCLGCHPIMLFFRILLSIKICKVWKIYLIGWSKLLSNVKINLDNRFNLWNIIRILLWNKWDFMQFMNLFLVKNNLRILQHYLIKQWVFANVQYFLYKINMYIKFLKMYIKLKLSLNRSIVVVLLAKFKILQ